MSPRTRTHLGELVAVLALCLAVGLVLGVLTSLR